MWTAKEGFLHMSDHLPLENQGLCGAPERLAVIAFAHPSIPRQVTR